MPPHRLRILHISDLHERALLDWMPSDRKTKVRATAPSRHRVLDPRRSNFFDIVREACAGGRADLVCFTGDAADWGLREEYERAARRLNAILDAAGASRERLYLVPGNHDVQRPKAEDTWEQLRKLAATGARAAEISNWMAGVGDPFGVDKTWRDKIGQRTAEFWRWVQEDLGRASLDPAAGPHGRLGYRAQVDGLGLPFPVHIIGLDSAWLAGDDSDQGKLLLTDRQIDMLTCSEEGDALPGFRLCLVHHPLGFLADGDRCRRLLADNVDLLLHGHQHDPIVETHEDPDRALRVIAAGSLYEGDEGDRWPNSFQVIDAWLDDDGQPLRYDIEFFGWSERGHWFRTGAIYREAPDGRLRWTTPRGQVVLAEQQRESAANPHRRAADFFIGRDAELEELKRALLGSGTGSRTAAIGAVQGMPGVGKSYLAARFAALHNDDFPGGVVRITFAADDSRSAEAVARDLCDQLSLRVAGTGSIWELLAGYLRGNGMLLIVENADAEPQAQAAAGLAAGLRGCTLIVTGRYQRLGRTAGAGWMPVTVTPFDEPHALAQLVGEHRPPAGAAETADHLKLVRTLGYLPLAIHLAAGYLAQPGATPDGYLAELRRSGLALAHPDKADPITEQGARAILSSTFNLSLKNVERRAGARRRRAHGRLCRIGARAAGRYWPEPGQGNHRSGGPGFRAADTRSGQFVVAGG